MYLSYLNDENQLSRGIPNIENSHLLIEAILIAEQSNEINLFISPDCRQIKVVPQSYSEAHFLILAVQEDFTMAIMSHSLFDPDEKLFNVGGNFESITAKFLEYLQQMDEFYCQMNVIDELCFIVEPLEISTKINWRTFKLDNNIYLKIVVNPLAPSSLAPTFYGPTTVVEAHREKYREGIVDWNASDDIYRNLLRIFGVMSFPQKNEDDARQEYCSICYIHRFNGQIPIISCDNARCLLIYHTVCLKEWFFTIREAKTFLDVTSGSCPSCKEKLSASFIQLLNS